MNALKQEFKCKLNIAITIKLAQLKSQIGYATCSERITGNFWYFPTSSGSSDAAYVSRTVERHMYSYCHNSGILVGQRHFCIVLWDVIPVVHKRNVFWSVVLCEAARIGGLPVVFCSVTQHIREIVLHKIHQSLFPPSAILSGAYSITIAHSVTTVCSNQSPYKKVNICTFLYILIGSFFFMWFVILFGFNMFAVCVYIYIRLLFYLFCPLALRVLLLGYF